MQSQVMQDQHTSHALLGNVRCVLIDNAAGASCRSKTQVAALSSPQGTAGSSQRGSTAGGHMQPLQLGPHVIPTNTPHIRYRLSNVFIQLEGTVHTCQVRESR